jgi:hypothetical protein
LGALPLSSIATRALFTSLSIPVISICSLTNETTKNHSRYQEGGVKRTYQLGKGIVIEMSQYQAEIYDGNKYCTNQMTLEEFLNITNDP